MIEQILSVEPDAVSRDCTHCKHMKAAHNWWCMSEEARQLHGSAIPCFYDCPFWEPARTVKQLKWWEKLLGGVICGYIIGD